jgi:CheY-like chemotaxis protein
MPEMDGVALAGRVRALRPALPLVLFSSLGRKETGATESPFAGYLSKPLRQSQLFDTLVGLFAHDREAVPRRRRRSARSTPAWRRATRCASCWPRTMS